MRYVKSQKEYFKISLSTLPLFFNHLYYFLSVSQTQMTTSHPMFLHTVHKEFNQNAVKTAYKKDLNIFHFQTRHRSV